jgi:hypothetical protein
MSRAVIADGTSKRILNLSLGEKSFQRLDDLAWATRQSKASVVRTLIEKATVEDLQKPRE